MEKHLKLFASKGKFTDSNNYVITDNDNLMICIDNDFGGNTDIYAIIENGIQKKIKVKNKCFEIDRKFLKIGELNITIVAICNNQELGRYFCVPIIVKELDNQIVAIDELEVMKQELKQEQEQFKQLKIELQEQIELIKKLTKSLIIGE